MLPILRILPVGGVLLAILIFLLALTPPSGVRHVLPDMEARGALIDRDAHPEWRQFLMQAALQRADELKRLRDLPDTPGMQMQSAPDAPAQTAIVITLPPPVTRTEAPVPHAEEVAPQQPPANDAAGPAPNGSAPEPTPTEAAPAANAEDAPRLLAALPPERGETDPEAEDVTGTINELPGATIPIDIGETSSTELPVVLPEERPPVNRTPERAKPPRDSRRKLPAQRTRRAKAGPKVAPKPQPAAHLNLFEVLFGPLRTQQRPALADTRGGTEIAVPSHQLNAAN